jgi:uncharacterized protein (DUF433 family)
VCRYEWMKAEIWTNYQDYNNIESDKRGGKPCIRGMRIIVYDVLNYLASDMTEAEILADFPDLTHEDIRACLAFAADRECKFVSHSRLLVGKILT